MAMRVLGLLACGLIASTARAEGPVELVTVKLTHDAPLERGRNTPLSLGVVPGPGLRLLDDGPLVVELEGTALTPAHRTLRRRDAVDPRAEAPRFEVEVRADRSGTPALVAHLTAWVCRARRCRPVTISTPLALTISESPRAPAHSGRVPPP